MSVRIHCVTVESRDPHAQATWWSGVLERKLQHDDSPGAPDAVLLPATGEGSDVLFLRVAERPAVRGAVHLDLEPTDRSRDEEVERVLALGARLVSDRRQPDGTGWVVLADPEGNEFCVNRSAAERAD